MNSSEFQNLVEKYIAEESTHEELESLRGRLKEPGSSAELDAIMDQQLADNPVPAADYPQVVERLKKKIVQRIQAEQKSIPRRRLSFLGRWTAAAAIIIIAGASGYLLFSKKSPRQSASKEHTSRPNDVAPGKQGAILTLDDNTTIVLDDLGNGVVADQHGTRVVLKNGQLIYDKNGAGTSKMAYNTMTTPKGRQFQLVLPDGSKVWMNAASSLRYPIAFTGNERKVEVNGEVYFEVAKNAAMPFKVVVNDNTEIEVLGTHFNVNSYRNEANINTTLLEGSVRITNGNEKAVLKPGQQGQVQYGATEAPIKIVNNVNVEKVMAWKNGLFDFQDVTLAEVMHQLERWYDIDVVYEKGVPPLEFMGKMGRDLRLSEVLRGLEMSEVHFRIEADRRLVVTP